MWKKQVPHRDMRSMDMTWQTQRRYHPKYRTAIYVREDLNARSVTVDSRQSFSYAIAIEVSGITVTVVNIYKPSPAGVEWPTPALPILPHPTVWWFQQPQYWVGIQSKLQRRWPLTSYLNGEMTTVSTYCMIQNRAVPSVQPAGSKTSSLSSRSLLCHVQWWT